MSGVLSEIITAMKTKDIMITALDKGQYNNSHNRHGINGMINRPGIKNQGIKGIIKGQGNKNNS